MCALISDSRLAIRVVAGTAMFMATLSRRTLSQNRLEQFLSYALQLDAGIAILLALGVA